MWHLQSNAKLAEVLLSLPLTEHFQGTALLICPYILRSNHLSQVIHILLINNENRLSYTVSIMPQ